MRSSPRFHTLLLLTSLLLAAPCWGMTLAETLSNPPSAVVAEPEREAITGYLRASLGEPYQLGATGNGAGFDCSGLVLRAYEAAGLDVPRESAQQLNAGVAVPLAALRAGDLLFYRMRSGAQRLHVAVYVGQGRAIHASVTHRRVREIDITQAIWMRNLVAARGLL